MEKIKLTKGELKKQRDALRQFERYLPTLQLKKQQLQLEIVRQDGVARETRGALEANKAASGPWLGLLREAPTGFHSWLVPSRVTVAARNIAGVDIPVCEHVSFARAEYDLFLVPLWVDAALEALRQAVRLREELKVIEQGIAILKQELRVTSQRVNLFEKVKIPGTRDAIRLIKIYIGDQMANAVGRSKIAKNRIEAGNEPGSVAV